MYAYSVVHGFNNSNGLYNNICMQYVPKCISRLAKCPSEKRIQIQNDSNANIRMNKSKLYHDTFF